MKTLVILFSIFCSGVSQIDTVVVCHEERRQTTQNHASIREELTKVADHTQARPIKVLYRAHPKIDLAMDGMLFYFEIYEAGSAANPDWKQTINLQSTKRMTVEEDEFADESKTQWKRNPADFDFILCLHIVLREKPKYSIFDELKIMVSEAYIVEKVSDSSVKKKWETSYNLEKGFNFQTMKKDGGKDFLLSQAAKIIASRAPIIKEIRAFIEAATR